MFNMKINKRQQLSNWERDILDEKQKLYAATDAWACIMLYKELQRLEETRDYELINVSDNDNENIKKKTNTSVDNETDIP